MAKRLSSRSTRQNGCKITTNFSNLQDFIQKNLVCARTSVIFCVKSCSLHESANEISGECVAGGVRNYYKFIFIHKKSGPEGSLFLYVVISALPLYMRVSTPNLRSRPAGYMQRRVFFASLTASYLVRIYVSSYASIAAIYPN